MFYGTGALDASIRALGGDISMAQSILVPLDSSVLAELALHEASILAMVPDATVILLHAVPPIEDVISDGEVIAVDQQRERQRIHALRYLESIRARPEWKNAQARVSAKMGRPADVIIDFARSHNVNWVVMSTHGRTGINRWVCGSVAAKVLEAADRTVVLVRSPAAKATESQIAD